MRAQEGTGKYGPRYQNNEWEHLNLEGTRKRRVVLECVCQGMGSGIRSIRKRVDLGSQYDMRNEI